MKFLSFLCTKWMENCEAMTSSTHSFAYSYGLVKKCFLKICEISKFHNFLIFQPIFIRFSLFCSENFTLSSEIKLDQLRTSPLKQAGMLHFLTSRSVFWNLFCSFQVVWHILNPYEWNILKELYFSFMRNNFPFLNGPFPLWYLSTFWLIPWRNIQEKVKKPLWTWYFLYRSQMHIPGYLVNIKERAKFITE